MIVQMIATFFDREAKPRLAFYARIIDDIVVLSMITLFATINPHCDNIGGIFECADYENINVRRNIAVFIYIVIGLIAIAIHIVMLMIGTIWQNYIEYVWLTTISQSLITYYWRSNQDVTLWQQSGLAILKVSWLVTQNLRVLS